MLQIIIILGILNLLLLFIILFKGLKVNKLKKKRFNESAKRIKPKLIYSDLIKINSPYNLPHDLVDLQIDEEDSVEVVNESISIVEVAE